MTKEQIEIVYPDQPGMARWASLLRKELENCHIPGKVAEKTGIRRLSEIREPWLIVLCTPDTPGDPAVEAAIERFTGMGYYHHILTMKISGEPRKSFPKALMYEKLEDGSVVEHEPLAANISASSERESRKRLKLEILRLAAPILGVSFDELRDRRRSRTRRILLAAGTVVLTGIAGFAVYAALHMLQIAGQQKELETRYAEAQEARAEAEEQRDIAREELSVTVGQQAKAVMEKGDNELALLLCLEFLPDCGRSGVMPEVLGSALKNLCKEGYVSVTSKEAYDRTRYPDEREGESSEAENSAKEGTAAGPGKKIYIAVEDDMNGRDGYLLGELGLKTWSEKYRCGVYTGSIYRNDSSQNLQLTWFHFQDREEEDYYLKSADGQYIGLTGPQFLPDGTVIGALFLTGRCFRYDPFEKVYLPFFGEEPSGEESGAVREAEQEEESGTDDPADGLPGVYEADEGVSGFLSFDGVPWILGVMRNGYRVYSQEPFAYLRTLEDVTDLQEIKNTELLCGMTKRGVAVYDRNSLEQRYVIEDEYTVNKNTYTAAAYPDGSGFLVWHISNNNGGEAVYDLWSGERLHVIAPDGMAWSDGLTSGKQLLGAVSQIPTLWDLESGAVAAEVKDVRETEPRPYGLEDESSGFRSGRVIFGHHSDMVLEYREPAVSVPEDLTGRLELARSLLGQRKLTAQERKKYYLDN